MLLERRARVTTRQPQEASQKDCAAQLHRFMADNLHRGPSLKDLAGFIGYSEKYCSDVFRARMGQPFSRYRKRLRLEKAERLLHESPATLAQIAEALGFHDQFAFSHFFKKATGYSPKLFRKRNGRLPLPQQPVPFHAKIMIDIEYGRLPLPEQPATVLRRLFPANEHARSGI